MRFTRISLQHFRNIPWAELAFTGGRQYLVGANGQGKTNLLEAAGFFTALRSFRLSENRGLIAQGQPEAALACTVAHEQRGETSIVVRLRSGGKEVLCDQERVAKVGDYLGRFPSVVFSSQDQQLVRGGPGARRRWLDLLLASTDPVYLDGLQRYHRALAERNRLLKAGGRLEELRAFELPLAEAAERVVRGRRAAMAFLSQRVAQAYASIADTDEAAGMTYVESGPVLAAEWLAQWERTRARDQALRSTTSGPHRDECELLIQGRGAREFASEGQQRTLALALRLAERSHLKEVLQAEPVLLADDVLGELDAQRRARFWSAISGVQQVIATGTELPSGPVGDWQVFRVEKGTFVSIT